MKNGIIGNKKHNMMMKLDGVEVTGIEKEEEEMKDLRWEDKIRTCKNKRRGEICVCKIKADRMRR